MERAQEPQGLKRPVYEVLSLFKAAVFAETVIRQAQELSAPYKSSFHILK